MDRQEWLAERQAAVVTVYDAEAPAYDEHEYPSDLQREWVARALRLIPPGGVVLDAQLVGQAHGMHQAGQLVEAVGPLADNLETEIDFGVAAQQHRHAQRYRRAQSTTASACGRKPGSMPARTSRSTASLRGTPRPSASELARVLRGCLKPA